MFSFGEGSYNDVKLGILLALPFRFSALEQHFSLHYDNDNDNNRKEGERAGNLASWKNVGNEGRMPDDLQLLGTR